MDENLGTQALQGGSPSPMRVQEIDVRPAPLVVVETPEAGDLASHPGELAVDRPNGIFITGRRGGRAAFQGQAENQSYHERREKMSGHVAPHCGRVQHDSNDLRRLPGLSVSSAASDQSLCPKQPVASRE